MLFNGLDNCKEMNVLFAGVELAFRGFHALAIDGPGQGESLRLRNHPARYDYEAALAGVAEKIECPLLITWGVEDKLTPRDVADQLYSASGSRDKTLKIFDRDTGGFEHCQADNRQVGIDYIADWLAARLIT